MTTKYPTCNCGINGYFELKLLWQLHITVVKYVTYQHYSCCYKLSFSFPSGKKGANDIFLYNLTVKKVYFNIMDELFYTLVIKC